MNYNEDEELKKIGSEKILNEHLTSNNIPKKGIKKEDIFTYIVMVLIIVAAVALIIMFLDKQGANPFRKTTTTGRTYHTIDTTSEKYVVPKTIDTTTTETKEMYVQTTKNIDEGASSVQPTTFHTVSKTTKNVEN